MATEKGKKWSFSIKILGVTIQITSGFSLLCAPEFKIGRIAQRRKPLGWPQTEKRTCDGERKRKQKMKKVMFGLAAMAALGVMAGGIPSSNAVGYNTLTTGNSPYRTYGTCFVTCGSTDGTFRLGDLTMEGSTWGTDWLNFIDPTTSIFDPLKNVTYYSVAEAVADGGTADDAEWEDIDENCKDDVSYPIGTAFLCNFVNPNIKITFSGEVNATVAYSTIDCTGKPYALVVSPYPGDLTAGDIKLVGSTWGTDWLNFIDPATSIVDPLRNITYYSEAEAIADGGTAADAEWEDIDENCKDDVEIPMGTGFLCNFASSSVQILFPVYTPSEN